MISDEQLDEAARNLMPRLVRIGDANPHRPPDYQPAQRVRQEAGLLAEMEQAWRTR